MEMLVYMLLSVAVISSVYQVLIGQNRLYSKEREVMDVRSTLRSAAELLAVELRMASPGDGDIYQIQGDSIVVRSLMGSGVVCAYGLAGNRGLALYSTSGTFGATVADSILIYTGGGSTGWVATKVQIATQGFVAALPTCAWNETPPEWVLAVDTVNSTYLDGLQVGSEVRAFRKTSYYTSQSDGRWWLMRGAGAPVDAEILAGPLASPSDSGLVFKYYDDKGDTTSVIANIGLIEIALRGESLGNVRRKGGVPTPQTDSLRLHVAIRG